MNLDPDGRGLANRSWRSCVRRLGRVGKRKTDWGERGVAVVGFSAPEIFRWLLLLSLLGRDGRRRREWRDGCGPGPLV
jgi:hypothetical protein